MVDLHCHVLPGLDDGATSWETAVGMCQMALEDGIDHIIATPHANHRYRFDRSRSEALILKLSERMEGRVKLALGCDLHLSYENFMAVMADPSEFTIASTRYLLLELNDYSISSSLPATLGRLIETGLVPIISHPERNPLLQNHPEQILEWVGAGSLVQVTANSLTGFWGAQAQATAEWLLNRDAVHVIASDAHGVGSRPPVLSKGRDAAANLCGAAQALALVKDNPLAIFEGESISRVPSLR